MKNLKPAQASLYFCNHSKLVNEQVFDKEQDHIHMTSVTAPLIADMAPVLSLVDNHKKECNRFIKDNNLKDKRPKDIDW